MSKQTCLYLLSLFLILIANYVVYPGRGQRDGNIYQSVDIVGFQDGEREAFITCLQELGCYNAVI